MRWTTLTVALFAISEVFASPAAIFSTKQKSQSGCHQIDAPSARHVMNYMLNGKEPPHRLRKYLHKFTSHSSNVLITLEGVQDYKSFFGSEASFEIPDAPSTQSFRGLTSSLVDTAVKNGKKAGHVLYDDNKGTVASFASSSDHKAFVHPTTYLSDLKRIIKDIANGDLYDSLVTMHIKSLKNAYEEHGVNSREHQSHRVEIAQFLKDVSTTLENSAADLIVIALPEHSHTEHTLAKRDFFDAEDIVEEAEEIMDEISKEAGEKAQEFIDNIGVSDAATDAAAFEAALGNDDVANALLGNVGPEIVDTSSMSFVAITPTASVEATPMTEATPIIDQILGTEFDRVGNATAIAQQTSSSLPTMSSSSVTSILSSSSAATATFNPLVPYADCYQDAQTCDDKTSMCSGHGSCMQTNRGCFACVCAKSVENKKTTYWAGSRCQKKDISSDFVLLFTTGVVMILILVASVSLLGSLGSMEAGVMTGARAKVD